MKILFIMPRFHTNLVPWIKELQLQGHSVEMFVLYKGGTEDYSTLSPKSFGLNLVSKIISRFMPPTEDISSQMIYGLPPLTTFIRSFLHFNPDVVIVRSPNMPFGLLACMMTMLLVKRLVIYTQGSKFASSLTIWRRLFHFIFVKMLNAIWITPVLGKPGSGAKTLPWLEYIPFATDIPVEAYCPKDYSSSVKILSVGKYDSQKNHHLLIKVVAELANTHDIELTIVGECSRDFHRTYLNSLHNTVTELGLENMIHFKINLTYNDLQKLYAQNHLFVLASTRDCASVANLEAMGAGLPVVCASSNGTACYTRHGITGFLIRDESYQDLLDSLKTAISDLKLLKTLSENTLNDVEREFTGERFYKRFTSVLRKRFGINID